MIQVNTYLNFPGTTEEAMNHYSKVFGVAITAMHRFKESPGYEKMPEDEWNKIMHASLPLAPHHVLMATDALESMGQTIKQGNNAYISLITESEAETERIFNGLAAGGKIEMPLNMTFWGAYCGMCADRFGIQWMVNYNLPQPGNDNKTTTNKK